MPRKITSQDEDKIKALLRETKSETTCHKHTVTELLKNCYRITECTQE